MFKYVIGCLNFVNITCHFTDRYKKRSDKKKWLEKRNSNMETTFVSITNLILSSILILPYLGYFFGNSNVTSLYVCKSL